MADESKGGSADALEKATVDSHLTFPVTLWERVENATYWEGYESPSKLVCMAVAEWIHAKEMKRPDQQYPRALEKRKRGPKPKKA